MKIIEPSVELMNAPKYEDLMRVIEMAGRVCYKSEDKIAEGSAEAVMEHGVLTVKFICDRGVTHEIVRHRLASYCQESTRYCNYSQDKFGNEITVIKPCFFEEGTMNYKAWENGCKAAEECYFALLENGATPQEARAVLPNSLKTELVMTANVREWRHFLRLRTSERAHPQMRQVANMLKEAFTRMYPALFEDIR